MPHQAVQLIAVHAPQGVQGVLGGHHPIVRGSIGRLAIQLCVPGEAGRWAGYRATESSLPVGLSLHQSHWFQGRDGNGWRTYLQCLIRVTIMMRSNLYFHCLVWLKSPFSIRMIITIITLRCMLFVCVCAFTWLLKVTEKITGWTLMNFAWRIGNERNFCIILEII